MAVVRGFALAQRRCSDSAESRERFGAKALAGWLSVRASPLATLCSRAPGRPAMARTIGLAQPKPAAGRGETRRAAGSPDQLHRHRLGAARVRTRPGFGESRAASTWDWPDCAASFAGLPGRSTPCLVCADSGLRWGATMAASLPVTAESQDVVHSASDIWCGRLLKSTTRGSFRAFANEM